MSAQPPLTPEEARALLAGQPATADGSITVAPLAPVPGANSYGQPTAGPTYNMSAEEAAHYLANADPTMSTAEDAGRSTVTGLQQGVAGLLGTPGDLLNLWDRGQTYLLDKSIQGAQDLTHSNLGLPHHLTNADVSQELNEVSRAQEIPTSNDLNTGIQQVTGPYHVPQTALGRYAQRGAQFAPMVFGGEGGLLAKGATWLGSSGGSQLAEDLAPEKYKPLAALAGAVAGGGPGAIWQAADAAPGRALARALEGLTPGDLTSGAQLRADALAGPGMQLTLPESIAQATGGKGSALLGLQHFVENTPAGKRLTGDFFTAQRPQQVSNATQWLADQIAAPDTKPSVTGLRNQELADALVRKAEQARTQEVNPYYTAADPKTVDPQGMAQILSDLDQEIAADKTGIVGGKLGQLRDALTETPASAGEAAGPAQRVGRETPNGTIYTMQPGTPEVPAQARVPLTDIGNLDRVRKDFRDRMGMLQTGEDAITKEQGARITDYLNRVDALMEKVPEFAAGKAKYQEVTPTLVEPVANGPVGQIAQTSKIPQQVAALYPRSPVEGAAAETGGAANILPPEVLANLTRHNIVDTGNEAQRDLVQGITNPYAGSRFARMVAGNSEQEAALTAGVNALDPSGDKARNLALALDAFRATGRREPVGSKTAFNEQMRTELGMSPMPIRAAGGLLDPLEWGRHIDKAVGGALYRKTIERLSAALMGDDPEVLARAQRLQGINPIVTGLLSGPRSNP